MSERARLVVRAIDYLEYVAAWVPIATLERPAWRVVRSDGEWVASSDTTKIRALAIRNLLRIWDSDEPSDWQPGVLTGAVEALRRAA